MPDEPNLDAAKEMLDMLERERIEYLKEVTSLLEYLLAASSVFGRAIGEISRHQAIAGWKEHCRDFLMVWDVLEEEKKK